MKKILIILILLFPGFSRSIAQSLLQTNLYSENKLVMNPAFAGVDVKPQFFLSYKKVAANVPGAPELFSFGGSAELYRNMSLGARLYKQTEGLFNTVRAYLDYSYNLNIFDDHYLRFGISAGLNSNKLNYSGIIAEDPSAIIDVASKSFEKLSFESAAGIVYQWKNLEWSIAAPVLFQTNGNGVFELNSLLQYNFSFAQSKIDLKPGVFLLYRKNNPVLYDLSIQAFWQKNFWVGIGYRNRPGIVISAGVRINNIGIAYASELGTEKYANMFNQIHEVSIAYTFKKPVKVLNDTLFDPLNNLVVKNKSENDSIIQTRENLVQPIIINFSETVLNEDSLYLNDNLNANEIAGVSPKNVKPVKLDSNKKALQLVETGDGVYTVRNNSGTKDSIYTPEFDESMLDSLIKEKKVIENQTVKKDDIRQAIYYTIKLFIDDSNMYLLTNAEIADKARVEQDKDGKFSYYYGSFGKLEDANKQIKKFSQYKDLKVEIIELKAFQ